MSRPRNAFLRALSEASYRALEPELQRVNLPPKEVLYRQGSRVDWVHFPETALISLLAVNSDGQNIETSLAGNEGAMGLAEACGSGEVGVEGIVQVDGRAHRAPASVVRFLVASDAEFRTTVWRLTEFQLAESRQSALCNAMHLVERRFARWMVESSERSAGRNPLPMTQEFLAAMLGVQRTTVTAFALELQRTGMIEYRRGQIELRDLPGLEDRACECRAVTRGHRNRLGFSLPSLAG